MVVIIYHAIPCFLSFFLSFPFFSFLSFLAWLAERKVSIAFQVCVWNMYGIYVIVVCVSVYHSSTYV
ncbi:hypothetical protein BC829DRAFT_393376 [Chytridium lagenaria]|nr:hypothetical protein BC829DRAFT_393376 [Chytridium lagenaria]